jgi:hypothetical protein
MKEGRRERWRKGHWLSSKASDSNYKKKINNLFKGMLLQTQGTLTPKPVVAKKKVKTQIKLKSLANSPSKMRPQKKSIPLGNDNSAVLFYICLFLSWLRKESLRVYMLRRLWGLHGDKQHAFNRTTFISSLFSFPLHSCGALEKLLSVLKQCTEYGVKSYLCHENLSAACNTEGWMMESKIKGRTWYWLRQQVQQKNLWVSPNKLRGSFEVEQMQKC